MDWQPIATAPLGEDILVWFDHGADTYHDTADPNLLTNYAAWAESGDFLDGKGFCVARLFGPHFESEDEYGKGYWMPTAVFARQSGDYEMVVNATHWMPLPKEPRA